MYKSEIKKMLQLSAVIGAVALCSPKANAGFAVGNSVTLGGEPVFSIQSGFAGFSPAARAVLAQDALDNAIATDAKLSPDCVKVESVNGSPSLVINGHRIATADFGCAKADGVSPQQLAQQWADKVKEKLANGQFISAYKQTLMLDNPIRSTVVSRNVTSINLPASTSLPIRLEQQVSTRQLRPGDEISAIVYENYRAGELMIPQGTQVYGRVSEVSPRQYQMVFDQLRTPDGRQTRMYGTLSACNLEAHAPNPVCTLAIPAGESTDARVPATIAIGTTNPAEAKTVAFVTSFDSDVTITPQQNLALILDKVTPIASLTSSVYY